MVLYSDDSNKEYHLIDFSDLHQQMLFRRYKYFENEYNIDILFKGVFSMNIVAEYKSFNLSVVAKEAGQVCIPFPSIPFMFKITDNRNVSSYIEATAFGVFHNYYPPKQSSIMDFSAENKEVYWSKKDVDLYLKGRG